MELKLSMTTAALVGEHNAADPDNPMRGWKGSKKALIDRILKLDRGHTFKEETQQAAATRTEAKAPKKAKAKAPKKAASKKSGGQERGAIRDYCHELLLKTVGKDKETGKPLGLTYPEVLAKVKERFPKASTSLGCLRWYATHLNSQHRPDRGKKPRAKVEMPMRPKAIAA